MVMQDSPIAQVHDDIHSPSLHHNASSGLSVYVFEKYMQN